MVLATCSKCGGEMRDNAFFCLHCGTPTEAALGVRPEEGIPYKAILCIYLLFILFPILLFAIHIFVPGM